MTAEELIAAAITAHRAGDLPQAEALYRQSLTLAEHPVALQNLGILLRATQRLPEAIAVLKRATVAAPGAPGGFYNLGNAYTAAGNLPAAIAAYEAAAALAPGDVNTLNNLALALRSARRIVESESVSRRAVALAPARADVLTNHAGTLSQLGRHAEAIAILQRAIALDPTLAEAHHNLALAFHGGRRFDDALAAAARARDLRPDFAATHAAIANIWHDLGDLPAALAAYLDALDRNPLDLVACSNYLLALTASGAAPEEVHATHVVLAEHFGAPDADAPITRVPSSPLRIGYFSPDFRDHAVASFIEPLLAHHDRAAFVITLYSDANPDAVTARLAALGHTFIDTRPLTDAALLARARADRLDIAIDLAGHTAGNRLAAFAARLAPVQITMLGYPATTGVPAIDFRLADVLADPPGPGDAHFTERLLRVAPPACAWCYRPHADAPPVSPLPPGVAFGSFNHAKKLSPRTLALWAEVLAAVPGSTLVLKAAGLSAVAARSRILSAFAAAGIDAARITILPHAPTVAAHLAAYSAVSIALDTLEYTGTTTTCEALHMGVPVITLAGDTHASRVGASLLTAAGLPHLVAADPAAFVALAVGLAADRAALAILRAALRPQLAASPLCNAAAYTIAVESAFRLALER